MGFGVLRCSMRDGEMADLPRHEHLDRMRFRLGAKAGSEQLIAQPIRRRRLSAKTKTTKTMMKY